MACKLVMLQGWKNVNWDDNFTGLHLAAQRGDKEAVRFMLDSRAVTACGLQDSSGKTPLDYARESERPSDVLELLEKHTLDATREKAAPSKRPADAASMDPTELYERLAK